MRKTRFFKDSKGSVEIQFNWAFVLIVGAILLLFFYSIVKSQQETSEIQIGYTVSTDLNSIFSSATESVGTMHKIVIPSTKIELTCQEYFINNVPRQFGNRIVFTPDYLKGRELITWALAWQMPYRVINFLYLTNPEIRYIIVDDGSDNAEKLYGMLPPEMTVDIVSDLALIRYQNNYKVRMIFFTLPTQPPQILVPAELLRMEEEDISAIYISPPADLEGSGTVKYFIRTGGVLQSDAITPYLGKESLFGAIFSETAELYECNMEKAFQRLGYVSSVYLNRTVIIQNHYLNLGSNCIDYYSNPVEYLSDIRSNSTNFTLINAAFIADNAESLEEYNQLAKSASCILMY